jgi:RNA polymerase sigma factor (TIGR02999 family)
MASASDNPLTAVLQAVQAGEPQAAAQLWPLVYGELHQLAQARMARLPAGQTLQPTALVHEAYLRLVDKEQVAWEGRRHFFFAAARAMRDILVEQARRKAGPKAGGSRQRQELEEETFAVVPPSEEVLAVDEALAELEQKDPLKAQLVELRYFSGLNMEEVAAVLGQSERTLHRHWRFVKAWLKSRLAEPDEPSATDTHGE